MPIEFSCTCGHLLRAEDEWAGRQARCSGCGQVVTVPCPVAAEEIALDETCNVRHEEPSPPIPDASPAPFVPTRPRPKRKQGFFARLARSFPGYREVVFRWKEPTSYLARLKGDVPARCMIIAGVWCLATSGMLVFFGMHVEPPGILAAPIGGAILSIFAFVVLFLGRRTASGRIKVYDDEIYRRRGYTALDFSSWSQWTKWPYGAIHRCVIVPGDAIGKSFSVILLCSASDIDMIGVPKNIDLGHLAEHMTAKGVPVVRGETIPPKFTKRVPFEIGAIFSAIGAVCLLGGFVFYAKYAWNRAPEVAEQEEGGDPFMDSVPRQKSGLEPQIREPMEWMHHTPRPPGPPRIPRPPWEADRSAEPAGVPFTAGETQLVGGSGGSPFQLVSAEKQPVLGFRYTMGSWNGQDALRELDPLYARVEPRDWQKIVMGRQGYAVGGLRVNAGEYVLGVQIVFMAIKRDGSLDTDDTYTSEWIGSSAAPATLVGGTGEKVIGVYGRRAAVMDAVGLLTAEP